MDRERIKRNMIQLVQNLKSGEMELLEVPCPALSPNGVLVRNHYSIISAGTESKTVKDARLGYIGKAMARQKEVRLVIESIKTQGVIQTYRAVMNRLDAPSPLGYSTAGEVIEAGPEIKNVKVGDFVACGGAGANHSEIVSVQKNLFVKIPEGVDLKYAAFTTVASISMQGIRQADLRLGENCVVIGLGLIGQLTLQLLSAGGIKPIGIDIDSRQVEFANKNGAGISFNRKQDDIEKIIYELTNGHGTDAVIITAGSSSNDPVEFAGRVCRRKGKVIIVGAVPTGFSREHYYKKELELKMSSSYGPGRYDPDYEEKGMDYPIGYVRWTENRNMQAFLELLAEKKLNLEPLITHIYDFNKAPDAYDMILKKEQPFIGVLLKYDLRSNTTSSLNMTDEIVKTGEESGKDKIATRQSDELNNYHPQIPKIGFIGAGNFAQNFLLPNLKDKSELVGVATSRSHTSKNIADKYGFNYASGNAEDIINDENINTIFIATRHNLHAKFVIKALQAGKNVFVEKPLAMNETELEEINSVIHKREDSPASHRMTSKPILFVGYNRRFSPLVVKLKEMDGSTLPKAINYRINAGTLPKEHWIQDPQTGGGRVIGEVCHFIDLCMFIAGSPITSVSAEAMDTADNLLDSVVISLKFRNGTVASISYFSNGSKLLPKESVEVFSGGRCFIINDFREMKIFGTKEEKLKLPKQDKGHAAEINEFISALKKGIPSPISFDELYLSSFVTFKVLDSVRTRSVIRL